MSALSDLQLWCGNVPIEYEQSEIRHDLAAYRIVPTGVKVFPRVLRDTIDVQPFWRFCLSFSLLFVFFLSRQLGVLSFSLISIPT